MCANFTTLFNQPWGKTEDLLSYESDQMLRGGKIALWGVGNLPGNFRLYERCYALCGESFGSHRYDHGQHLAQGLLLLRHFDD